MPSPGAPLPRVSFFDRKYAKMFHGFMVGDTCDVVMTVRIDTIGQNEAILEVLSCGIAGAPKSVKEAARRAENELQYVRTQTDPSIG